MTLAGALLCVRLWSAQVEAAVRWELVHRPTVPTRVRVKEPQGRPR